MKMGRIGVVMVAALLFSMTSVRAQDTTPRYKVVGYYTSYDIYDQQFFITDIPADQLTHLNYHAIAVSANGQCASADEWADTKFSYPGDKPTDRVRGNFKQVQLLKKSHPALKVLMSIGGWDQSRYFSDAAQNKDTRIRFARSCLAFMRDNGFDGIDVDWRYPVEGGKEGNLTRPEDKANYTLLIAELRGQIEYWSNRDNKRYLLTMTAPSVEPLFKNIQIELVHGDLDWINLTTYGFQGSWSELASPAAPLYGSAKDPRGDVIRAQYNVAGAVKAYLDAGVPANKIVVGIPFYGQAWSNVRPNDFFGLYQAASGIPVGTRPGGILFYRDLVPLIASDTYTKYFDDETKSSWMYSASRRIAISYEDKASITNKVAYIKTTGLGGAMVWELSFDDDAHTLMTALATGLNGK